MACEDIFRMKLNEHFRVKSSSFFEQLIQWHETIKSGQKEYRPASIDVDGGIGFNGFNFTLGVDYKETELILDRWRNEERASKKFTLSKNEYEKHFERSLPESIQKAMIDAWSNCNLRTSGGISFESVVVDTNAESTRVDLKISHIDNQYTNALEVTGVFVEHGIDTSDPTNRDPFGYLADDANPFVFGGNSKTLSITIPNNDKWFRIRLDLKTPGANNQDYSVVYHIPPAMKVTEEKITFDVPRQTIGLIGYLAPDCNNKTIDSDTVRFKGTGAITRDPSNGNLVLKSSLSIEETSGSGMLGKHPTYIENQSSLKHINNTLPKDTHFFLIQGKRKTKIPDIKNVSRSTLFDSCDLFLVSDREHAIAISPTNQNYELVPGTKPKITNNSIVTNFGWDPRTRMFTISYEDFKIEAITLRVLDIGGPETEWIAV
tara:strand:+ start:511 stop:1806 length:1296 start_codon:yes stop_codon:yes gene_type:complete